MVTLTDATALVPFREPKEDSTAVDNPKSFMDLSSFIDKVIVPREQEKRDYMAWTFQGVVTHFANHDDEQADWERVQAAAKEAFIQSRLDEEADADEAEAKRVRQGDSLLKRVTKWALKKIVKWVVKTAVRAVFRFVKWIVKEVIVRGMMGMVEWLVRPVLMEVLGFIGLNPELWPVIVVLGGAAVLGYAAWDMFFKGNKDSLKDANADKSNLADQADALLESPVRMEGMAGAPIAAGAPGEAGAPIRAITQSGAWSLGQTSKRFESGSGGAGTISSGAGDLGGVSYGIYQFSSKTGGVQEFLKNTPYGKEFEGLVPATDAFNAKWKELAKDPAFGQAQHDFIKGQYYDVQMRRLKQAGFDFSDRGPAVQDNIWSTAVQMRGLTLKVVQGALAGQDWQKWTDAQIVAAIQDYKYANTEKLFSKSPTLWGGLRKRAESEKASLVQLANNTQYPQGATSSLPDAQVAMQNGATTQPNGKPNNGTASAPGQRMANGNVVASKDGSNGNTVIRGPQGVLIAVNA